MGVSNVHQFLHHFKNSSTYDAFWPTYTSIAQSRFYCCESFLLNLESIQPKRLQLTCTIQTSLARAITKAPKRHHITPILKRFHWLNISDLTHFKVIIDPLFQTIFNPLHNAHTFAYSSPSNHLLLSFNY